MMDVESVITLFLIFLNILIVSYSLKNNSDNELKTSDNISKKSTNLHIFISNIVIFILINLSFMIFFVPLLVSIRIGFLNDILEFIFDFTLFHLDIYLIWSLFSKKYNFVKASIDFCIIQLIKIIVIYYFNYSPNILSNLLKWLMI